MPDLDKSGTYYHMTKTGTYETQGSSNSRPCNWTHLGPNWDQKNTIEDTYATFIANGEVAPGEVARVTLKSGDYFLSNGCLPWHYLG